MVGGIRRDSTSPGDETFESIGRGVQCRRDEAHLAGSIECIGSQGEIVGKCRRNPCEPVQRSADPTRQQPRDTDTGRDHGEDEHGEPQLRAPHLRDDGILQQRHANGGHHRGVLHDRCGNEAQVRIHGRRRTNGDDQGAIECLVDLRPIEWAIQGRAVTVGDEGAGGVDDDDAGTGSQCDGFDRGLPTLTGLGSQDGCRAEGLDLEFLDEARALARSRLQTQGHGKCERDHSDEQGDRPDEPAPHGVPSASRYPTPRTVSMRPGSPSLRRRDAMWTSRVLPVPTHTGSQTREKSS